ncbi:RNA polymerase sigma factor [Acetobacterium sp. K1/6]|uniref:RNA polymerase sigma factor n=1 Tax=Acetobacterium sp. K1/6 TaxID=3055467 RepID=UPI002ACAC733|nr:sigma-70 family RNA polymerase sigma factor [Acetobacterium sp. K1/6]MDZ5725639.1 sigma-70 family RNA polymerase sigma factor [Acetobacterium sp. K1/6]
MNNKTDDANEKIELALNGDKQALELLLGSVQDMVYNLSLRMLGNPHDAEDATQEILIKTMTGLSSFRKESAFSTWVYRIATNYLLNYKNSFFAKQPPLSFEFYGADIEAGFLRNNPGMMNGVDEEILTHELKMSCTNVMLQCFDPESRLIYVLGIMFKVDSKVCGEILRITPEAYRQRLSRIRQKMAGFLKQYCGLASPEKCNCQKRIGYAITNHRLNPANLEYHQLEKVDEDVALDYLAAIEEMDMESAIFAKLPSYRSPQNTKDFLQNILFSENMATIMGQA